MIEGRFLASQAAARVVEKTVVKLAAGEAFLVLSGHVELFDGWRRILSTDAVEEPERPRGGTGPDDREDERPLPPLAEGEELVVVARRVSPRTSRSPSRSSRRRRLIAELKRLGIGRPSTYQTVIPLLLSRGWAIEVAPSAKRMPRTSAALPALVPTPAGQDLCDFLAGALPSLVDYQFTASMETALDEIEQGTRRRTEVAASWWARFEQELTVAKQRQPQLPERKDLGPCPNCAKEGRAGRLRLIHGVNSQTREAI